MNEDRGIRSGLTISCIAHACALVLALITLSAHPVEAPATAAMPVSFISTSDFTKLTQGVKNAPQLKIDQPKPLADKVDTAKPVEQLAPKVADKKPEITTDTSAAKPPPKPETKPDPKPPEKAEKPKPPEYKPDQIADLLKKDAAKPPPKPDNQSPQKPAQTTPKFDANQVAQLLDHRTPQRQMAAAETLNSAANLGASLGAPNAQMSQSEIDALRARISSCWSSAARRRHQFEALRRAARAVQARRLDGQRADAGRGHGVATGPGASRERQARAAVVPAVHDAQARTLRSVERSRAQI